MSNFFKGLTAVIVGLILIFVIFGISNLLISLLMYVLLKVPILGAWLSRTWFQDICTAGPASLIAYSAGSSVISKITSSSRKAEKTSLMVVGITMLSVHIISAIITIIAMIMLSDYDNTLPANFANILGGIALISFARDC